MNIPVYQTWKERKRTNPFTKFRDFPSIPITFPFNHLRASQVDRPPGLSLHLRYNVAGRSFAGGGFSPEGRLRT